MKPTNLRSRLTRLAGIGALGVSVVYSAVAVNAADHLDAPGVMADGRTDINDLYAFQSPTDPNNTVLAMTVNPGAGTISGTTFDPKATYAFNIDTNGDAVADKTITVDFKAVNEKGQRYTVKMDGIVLAKGSVGTPTGIRKVGKLGGHVTAGVFDDPFFFDLAGFRNGFQFTGDDFFTGLNVSAIVIEIPSSRLSSSPDIGVWATTFFTPGEQIDRMGRPAVATALIGADRKDAFNQGTPANDRAEFGDEVRAAIASLNGGDTATAAAITDVLLPDVLTFNTGDSSGFLNGRQLANDVIDAELGLLTNGALTTDGVDANDQPFVATFPYLAPAN